MLSTPFSGPTLLLSGSHNYLVLLAGLRVFCDVCIAYWTPFQTQLTGSSTPGPSTFATPTSVCPSESPHWSYTRSQNHIYIEPWMCHCFWVNFVVFICSYIRGGLDSLLILANTRHSFLCYFTSTYPTIFRANFDLEPRVKCLLF